MADGTAIEWTDATWNPVRGCSRVSEGCRHCYAEAIAARFSDAGSPFHTFADRDLPGSKWTGKVQTVWGVIEQPLRWRRPRRIFVNSMADLFHESLDIEELATIFATMIAAVHLRGHTFQILTKRAGYMRCVLTQEQFWEQVNAEVSMTVLDQTDPLCRRSDDARATCQEYGPENPPPGIWLGVSVENQAAADERIPDLLATPAALRFLSCEPLLGPIDLRPWLPGDIGWVIAGGESGPNARPMHPEWLRSLRDQCVAGAVPFFFKQWGEWCPESVAVSRKAAESALRIDLDGSTRVARYGARRPGEVTIQRVGKKAAGALLDDREWREMPA